jgi:hypothetical protein
MFFLPLYLSSKLNDLCVADLTGLAKLLQRRGLQTSQGMSSFDRKKDENPATVRLKL